MSLLRFILSQLKHARRYNKVLRVLLRYGFDDYISGLDKKKGFSILKLFISKKRRLKAQQLTKWQRMRLVCEDLGPTFTKFGQILSNRRDLLPEPLIEELTKLQDNVPPFSSRVARKIIENELNNNIDDLFDDFEETPFASASMAQVHRATLKTGEKVVLKIQRPDIKKVIEEDLLIMHDVAVALEKRMPSIQHFDPQGLVQQFEESIRYEMDFLHESINLKRFAYNFKEDEHIRAPKVYEDYCSTKLLTMEFIEGTKPMNFEVLKMYGVDRKWLADKIINAFFIQSFNHGFFHADPHAGNIIISPDKKIYFIDFGMMGTILKKDMQYLGMMILAIEQQNVNQLMSAISYLTNIITFQNKKKLEYDLMEFVNKYAYTENFHLQISSILTELTTVIQQHNLKVPAHFFLLIRASFAVEGLVRDIDPKIVIMEKFRPIIKKKMEKELNPISTGRKILNSLYELANYMEDFPADLKQTMKLVKRGHVKVDLEHKGMEPFVQSLEKASRQLMATIMISALLLVSAFFMVIDAEPKWYGFPVYSIIGVAIATFIGFTYFLRVSMQKKDYKK